MPAMNGVASKVTRYLKFGFAVRCEAVATPRRKDSFTLLGYALWLNKSVGLSHIRGVAPELICLLSAGHSHRLLISGGKAEPNMAHDF